MEEFRLEFEKEIGESMMLANRRNYMKFKRILGFHQKELLFFIPVPVWLKVKLKTVDMLVFLLRTVMYYTHGIKSIITGQLIDHVEYTNSKHYFSVVGKNTNHINIRSVGVCFMQKMFYLISC
jgi:hypothetical protein